MMSSDQAGAASEIRCATTKNEFNVGAVWPFALTTAVRIRHISVLPTVVFRMSVRRFSLMDVAPDFLVLGKLARFKLGVNQLPVDADFEAATIRGNQNQLLDSCFEFRNQLFGQTDRFRFVVSNLTVNDFYVHRLAFFHQKY